MNRNFHQYSTSTPMFTVTASPVSFNNNRIQSGTHEPINRRHSNHVSQQKIHRKPVPSLNSVPQPARNEKEVYLVNEANFKENIPPPTGVHSQKGRNSVLPVEKNTSFWYPRTGKENEPLKRNIGKKLRGLLQPQRAQLEEASRWQHEADSKISLCRSQTPEPENCQLNPFQTLRGADAIADQKRLIFQEANFSQIDTYASTVQQRGPLLTPTILSQKFLVRPYRRELFQIRALFIWVVQNIRPEYHQKRNDLILLQKQQAYLTQHYVQSEKPFLLKQKLSKHTPEEDQEPWLSEKLDAVDFLQEEATLLSKPTQESTEDVLEKRVCHSALGMAQLFIEMAIAAGFADAKVIYGYLKAPKDTVEKAEQPLPVNHAWCAVKVEGEYRFVDCWLASPYHPYNDNKIDPHWFLTLPSDMAMTHFPEKKKNQHLFRSITPHAFFSIPYVRNVFFWNKMYVLDYKMHQSDSIVYMSLKVLPKTHCYAEIESENGIHSRGLTQCSKEDEERLCKIKAVLPAGHTKGWLKVYTQQRGVQKGQLAMCLQVTASQPSTGFDFVKLHGLDNPDGFHVQEPQCYQLYPLQTYRFVIGGSRPMYRAAHHKLAVKSPHGKLHKLTYQPQDQSYEVNVKVSEVGKWLLVCLVHHTGGWYAVAEWNCMVSK